MLLLLHVHTCPHAEWNSSKLLSFLDQVHIVTPPNSLSTLQPSRHSKTSSVNLHYLSDGKCSTGHHHLIRVSPNPMSTLLPLVLVLCLQSARGGWSWKFCCRLLAMGYVYNMSIVDDVTYLALYLQVIWHILLTHYCCSIKNKASFPFPVERWWWRWQRQRSTATCVGMRTRNVSPWS